MDKLDIVRERIVLVIKDIKEDKVRAELSVLFTEYDTAFRKSIKEVKRQCQTSKSKPQQM